jgi:hypothetical protein
MALVEEINKSHVAVRAFAITLFLSPFWYLSTFLFANNFYKSADNLVVFSFCIILSLSSSIVFYIFVDKTTELKKTAEPLLNGMTASVFVIAIWLLLLMFLNFTSKFIFGKELHFYWFVVIYFTPIIILAILASLFSNRKKFLKK